MKKSFFSKMAWRNIKSNRKLYVPYSISSILSVALFQMMISLTTNDFVRERSASLPVLFEMGTIVIGVFSVIFIFYINSFLMKRRKKEIGLYSVLGLEKRHVAQILIIENFIVSGFNILMGILTGILFGQMSFLLLNYLTRFPSTTDYSTSWTVAGLTILVFAGLFTLTLIYNLVQVTFSNPIQLLKGSKEGEKEPKSSPVLFLIGLLSLGTGYYMSLTIENSISALNQFFVAVIFVIAGTYLLFTTGSIIILKALKRNKAFYYKPGPFIAISGMLYRMKQHAVGLANISILSVMVIISLSTTVTLYVGTEETLSNRFPEENNLTIKTEPDINGKKLKETIETIQSDLSDLSTEEGVAMKNEYAFRYVNMWGAMEGNRLSFRPLDLDGEMPTHIMLMPLEDYNQLVEVPRQLDPNELLVHDTGFYDIKDTLTINDEAFQLERTSKIPDMMNTSDLFGELLFLVSPNTDIIESLIVHYNAHVADEYPISYSGNLFWSTEEEDSSYSTIIDERLREGEYPAGISYESRENNREEWYSMNGGFLFIGTFLGALFTIGAVLITYYKQISEGYDDRERIQIMQKVGLDKETTKKATQSQIVWMFSLPLTTAAVHTAFAYPMVQKLLEIFYITSTRLFLIGTFSVILVYSLIYYAIYRITSKLYLNIVE